jgi:hypothetical protein
MAQLLAADNVVVSIPSSVCKMMANLPPPQAAPAAPAAAPFWASDIKIFVDFCLGVTPQEAPPAAAAALINLVIVAEIAHWSGAHDAMEVARDEILGVLRSEPLENTVRPRIKQLYNELL